MEVVFLPVLAEVFAAAVLSVAVLGVAARLAAGFFSVAALPACPDSEPFGSVICCSVVKMVLVKRGATQTVGCSVFLGRNIGVAVE